MLLYPTLLYFDCCFKLLNFEVIRYTAKLTDRVSKRFTHIQVNNIIPVHLRTWGILNSIIPISELNIYSPRFWTHMELHLFFFGTETFTFAHHLSLTPGMTWLLSLCSLDLKLIAHCMLLTTSSICFWFTWTSCSCLESTQPPMAFCPYKAHDHADWSLGQGEGGQFPVSMSLGSFILFLNLQ